MEEKLSSTSALTKNNSLKLLTCNVKDITDYEALVDEILRLSVPIVCLQEFKSDDQREKITRAFKTKGYTGVRFSGCLDIIFVRNDAIPSKKEYISFTNTCQNRGVIVYTYLIKNHNGIFSSLSNDITNKVIQLKICTSQLESGGTGGGIRKSQIRDLNVILSNSVSPLEDKTLEKTLEDKTNIECIIFAGDTNISSWQTELNFLTPGHPEKTKIKELGSDDKKWYDAWREKGTSENEITNDETKDRMDRVWYKGEKLRCTSYNLFYPFSNSTRKGVIVDFSFDF